MLMVVAETTRSHRAGVSPQSGADARTGSTLISSLAPLAFSFLLAFSCLTPAQAAIVADNHAPGGQQPQIANSANGTPQVNIQTPSGAGVSRNVYSQFDVDGRGVVLNNSHANTSTQLAGMVAGNPNLAKGEARVILNEVNTRDPELTGMAISRLPDKKRRWLSLTLPELAATAAGSSMPTARR